MICHHDGRTSPSRPAKTAYLRHEPVGRSTRTGLRRRTVMGHPAGTLVWGFRPESTAAPAEAGAE